MPDKEAEYTGARGVEPCSEYRSEEQKMEPDSLLTVTRPNTKYSILTIREDSWLEGPKSWKVTLIGLGQTYSHTLADPFQTIEESELKWYVESFALKNPFDIVRAGKVESQLREYSIHFVSSIETAITKLSDGLGSCDVPGTISALCLQILSAKEESKFNKIPWELFEDMSLWAVFKVPILVYRQIKTTQNSLQETKKERINILFVSARPSYEKDEPYRIISKPVFEMVEGLKTVQVDFLRPATWINFKKLLTERKGHYDVVHFDLHGGISSGVPFLEFSPGGGFQPQIWKIRASLVAGVIAKAKVKTLILNACKSAQTQDSEVTNIAIQFVRAGAQNAIGMSFLATVELASIFMVTFYEAYLVKRLELENAVLLARAKLRTFKKRKARFAMEVEVSDACVPILVQRYSDSSNLPILDLNMTEPSDRAHQSTSSKSNLSILGRDADLLQLEENFSASKIVLLTGMRGAGKTVFGKYVAEWWEKSHFVDRSILCSFLSYQDDLGKFYEDFLVSDNLTRTTSTRRQLCDAFHASRYLVVLDDCSPKVPFGHQSTSWDLVDSQFRNFLDEFDREDSKCLLLLISDTARAERWTKRAPFRHQPMGELTQTDASDIARQILDQPTFNPKWGPEDLEAVEDLIHYHEKNPLFLAIFLPLLRTADHTPTRFLERLYLTLPEGGRERIEEKLHKLYEQSAKSSLLFSFNQYFLGYLVVNEINDHILLIRALSPFQKQFPQGYLTWIKNKHVTISETSPVEQFLASLHGRGLIFKDDDLDKESRHMDEHFIKMHPLLPYLLRYALEILSPNRVGILGAYKVYQTLFWEFYEKRLFRVTRDIAYQNARCTAYARDIENIMNVMVISMETEIFGKQAVNTVDAILFHPEIRALLSQSQTRRLYGILEDCSIRYQTLITDTTSRGVLEQAFRIIDFIGVHPSRGEPSGYLHPNIERGKCLLQVIQDRFPNEAFTVACEMWYEAHELTARGPLAAENYSKVKDLLLESAPGDQFWKHVFISSQMQIVSFVADELPSASFPVQPFEALIAQFTKKIENTFLNSFGDPQLCSAAISLYNASTTLGGKSQALGKALNDLSGSKVVHMFPKAWQYLASAWIPGMKPCKELSVLERALEISMEHRDRAAEFFVRDILFWMRAEMKEVKAAVQHNERLQALEQGIQAISFEPSSRGRISERYIRAGVLLIDESNSRQPDPESKARDYFKESLKYVDGLPGFGEVKYRANYSLCTSYRKSGMHKESLQHVITVVRLERGPEKEDLPPLSHTFKEGEFLWQYIGILTSDVRANPDLGPKAIPLDLMDAVASKIGWHRYYFRQWLPVCSEAMLYYESTETFDGTWATCLGTFKKFLWGAQELIFASDAYLAQKMIWAISKDRGFSDQEATAWLECVAEDPAEDALNRLVKLTSQWPRMTPGEYGRGN